MFIRQSFIVAALVLAYGGCGLRIPTKEERRASISAHVHTRIAGERIQEFFRQRTALVISSNGPIVIFPFDDSDRARFPLRAVARSSGAAAAIDVRGYFITADHNFEDAPYIAFYDSDRLRVVRSRIVWRGNGLNNERDLALLAVPYRLKHAFEWAPNIRPGVGSFAAGIQTEGRYQFSLVYVSGRVLSTSKRSAGTTVIHDGPLQRGDSGGPLADASGRLLGVNNRIHLSIFQSGPVGIAERPDLNFISELIAADVAAQGK